MTFPGGNIRDTFTRFVRERMTDYFIDGAADTSYII